jgi:integrase
MSARHIRPLARPGSSSHPARTQTLTRLLSAAAEATRPADSRDEASYHDPARAIALALPASPEDAAEIIEGELVADDNEVEFGELISHSILESHLVRGRLVPARTTDLSLLPDDDAERTVARARRLDELRARAWSETTLLSYGYAVNAWRSWCDTEGVPPLPLAPQRVADHLLDYAFESLPAAAEGNEEPLALVPRVSAGSVSLRLAALNKLAEFVGVPRPGDNAAVAEVVRGIRRVIGTDRRHRKAALDLDRLYRCVEAATGASLISARARALLLLRARTAATTGQVAKLEWADVTLGDDGVSLVLGRTHRHGEGTAVEVPKHTNPQLCLHTVLTRLRRISGERNDSLRFVICRTDGEQMSRQGPYLAVRRLVGDSGWADVPRMTDRQLAKLLTDRAPVTETVTIRDTTALLVGFYTATRRSNTVALNWGDLTDLGDDGFEIVLRRSKTDQEGAGATVFAPQGPVQLPSRCPATALRRWRRHLTTVLGRAPRPDEPVFPVLTSAGTLSLTDGGRTRRMKGRDLNDLVQRLTVAAGLAPATGRNPYGAHSLRIGFVTEALRDDKLTIPEVQDVTKHKSVDVLIGYRREVNAAKNNPSRKLINLLGT